MVMRPLPRELEGRVFTRSEGLAAGITPRVLEGPRVVRIHAGVYRYADTEPTFALRVEAARKVLPADAALSHLSCLMWLGLQVGPQLPLHFSTNSSTHVERAGIRVHRRQGLLRPRVVSGIPTLGPDRTFVDCGTLLSLRRMVEVGDWLVANGHTDLLTLRAYVIQSHLDGVVRARDAASLVREGAESVRESALRWHLCREGLPESVRESALRWHLCREGLPEPELNTDILDELGRFLARGDLVYRQWKVLVEYDGWHHERDALQRQRDHLRREALEAAGWRVIVITAADMAAPYSVVRRVREALVQRGFRP